MIRDYKKLGFTSQSITKIIYILVILHLVNAQYLRKIRVELQFCKSISNLIWASNIYLILFINLLVEVNERTCMKRGRSVQNEGALIMHRIRTQMESRENTLFDNNLGLLKRETPGGNSLGKQYRASFK